MVIQEIVERYFDAWRRRNVDDVMRLLHKNASFYDAFWGETCAGADLHSYLSATLDEDALVYQMVGCPIVVGSSAVFRYNAYNASNPDTIIFNGAETITVDNGKIVAISDHYCDPDFESLQEVAKLAASRHGRAAYAKSGLCAIKSVRFKQKLANLIEQEKVYLDSRLSMAQLADHIGCSVNHLSQVLDREYGTNFHGFLNKHRVQHARDLLTQKSADNDYVNRVAAQVGFASTAVFYREFKKTFGVTPAEYRQTHS